MTFDHHYLSMGRAHLSTHAGAAAVLHGPLIFLAREQLECMTVV